MKKSISRCIALLLALLAGLHAPAQTDEKRPVSVGDSVMLRHFSAKSSVPWVADGFLDLSPNGKRVAYALRETNLQANVNEVAIYILDLPEKIGVPLPALGRGKEIFRTQALPSGSRYALYIVSQESRQIQFRWLFDNRTLLVLHQPAGEKFPVVSRVDVATTTSRIVCRPGIEVTDFVASRNGEVIVVKGRAGTHGNGPLQDPMGIMLTTSNYRDADLEKAFMSGKTGLHEWQLRVFDLKRRVDRLLFSSNQTSSIGTEEFVEALSVAPNARYVAILTNSTKVKTPERWQAESDRTRLTYKFVVFDLEQTKDLPNPRLGFDAPISPNSFRTQWSDDGSSFLIVAPPQVSSRHKDLKETTSDSRRLRLHAVDARTGKVDEVVGNFTPSSDEILLYDQLASRVVVRNPEGELATYRRPADKGGWALEKKIATSVVRDRTAREYKVDFAANDRIIVSLEQSVDTPPDLWVTEIATGKRTRFTEANPEVRSQRRPRIEKITIKGSYGADYWGYLAYPLDYAPGKRYPAVIMMKSWNETFIHTAQPFYNEFPPLQLSASGVMVLMLNTPRAPDDKLPAEFRSLKGELKLWLPEIDGIRMAKRQLAELGLIDKDRVGLMSFSHSVRGMNYALSHPTENGGAPEWAAAIGDDGHTFDYEAYIRYNNSVSQYGGPPYGDSRKNWEKYSQAWNADKVRTPTITLEHGSYLFTTGEWFVALRDQGKPVERLWFPDGGHTLASPQFRESWMHWSIDWMRFWLQDYEGQAPPHDPDRYVRWRKMRQQHRWNETLLAEGKDPAQEYMNLRMAGKEPTFEDDAKAAAAVQKTPE